MPGWTGRASVRRALLDLPARYQCQQSAQSFLIQPFFMDEVTDATHPQQVVVGEKPAVVSPCGLEQAAFLIQAKSAWVNAQEFGGDAYRVQRGSAIGHLLLPFISLAYEQQQLSWIISCSYFIVKYIDNSCPLSPFKAHSRAGSNRR
jgi:hypothetical protein